MGRPSADRPAAGSAVAGLCARAAAKAAPRRNIKRAQRHRQVEPLVPIVKVGRHGQRLAAGARIWHVSASTSVSALLLAVAVRFFVHSVVTVILDIEICVCGGSDPSKLGLPMLRESRNSPPSHNQQTQRDGTNKSCCGTGRAQCAVNRCLTKRIAVRSDCAGKSKGRGTGEEGPRTRS